MKNSDKYRHLLKIIKGYGSVVVSYSGGVDSTFLLRAAVEALGSDSVLGCIAAGPTLPKSQYESAIRIARKMAVNVRRVETEEFEDEAFTANDAARCFYCKSHLLKALNEIAREQGYNAVLVGSNVDDKSDYRPGHRAIAKYRAQTPLIEAGFTKDDIRAMSRQLGLETADIPASPCLASRVGYGLRLTDERLAQVEKAEDILREHGFTEFRVRHHGELARIELKQEEIAKAVHTEFRRLIVERLKELGFKYVSLDLEGFRSGAMNETLSEQEKKRNL